MAALRRRVSYLVLLLALVFAALGVRLLQFTVVQGPRLAQAAFLERIRQQVLPARRGEILDAEGRVLAANVTLVNVVVEPKIFPTSQIPRLAAALGESPGQLAQAIRHGSPWYAPVAQNLSESQAQRLSALPLTGVVLVPHAARFYPNGSLLGPVLGFVGSQDQGLAGVEYEYNGLLAGHPGEQTYQVDAGGNPLPFLPHTVTPPQNGDTVELTLDRTLSAFAQEVLDAGIRRTKARTGRILVMDPNTGAILAMAQYPSPNPNHPFSSPAAWWDDQIVQNAEPPGSTFKPVTAAAALETGVATPSTRWYDPGYKVIDGVVVHGWEWPRSFGWVNLTQALEHSSDIAFMDMGLALGVSRFYRFLHLFGLLTPPPVDLPGATAGLFLPPQVVRPIDLATMAFGQTNEISALQLAEAVSAVANGGLLLRPHVLKEVLSPDGKVLRVVRPQVIRRVMPPWVAQEIVKGMAAVITPQGTGALAAVPGYVLAGKTGTAQLVRAGHVSTSQYMSSFIGFGPLPHPRVLILVQLDHPQGQYYGGQIAAPLFAQLMGETLRYLGIPPSQPTPQPGLTQVPQVVGLPYAQGVATLGAHHLTAFPEGSGPWIAAVVPDAGTWVVKGQAVLVVRSTTRPRPVFLAGNVPDLVGLPLRKAEMAAWDAGLRLAPQGSGVAVSQWPLPGTRLPPGSTVRARFVLPPLPRVRVRP